MKHITAAFICIVTTTSVVLAASAPGQNNQPSAAVGPNKSPLSTPKDKPILEITGKIGTSNKDGTAVFDRAMLESLGMATIKTRTPWHTGVVTFEGVPLAKLMELVGARGTTVKARALDGYATDVPIEDFAKFGVILALKRNGQYMSEADRGPLFIIYPYDSKPELKNVTYYGRSAFKLKSLEVL